MKHFKSFLRSGLLFLAVLCVSLAFQGGALKADAYYYGRPAELTQTGTSATSVTLTWSPAEGAGSYRVEYRPYSSTDSTYTVAGITDGTRFQISGLAAGTRYYVKVYALSPEGEGSGCAYLYDARTTPCAPKNFRQAKWWYFIKKLDVEWDKADGVDGVVVTLYNSKGKKVKSVDARYSAGFSDMKDQVYTVKAYSYATICGKKYKSKTVSIKCFNQARITSISAKSKKLTVKWGKVGGATGYDVYVSTKAKTGYKKVASVKSSVNKLVIKKFAGKSISAKKTYYVYVVTRLNKNGSGALYYWDTKTKNYGYLT